MTDHRTDTPITGPYVLARLATTPPPGSEGVVPFICWGVYNVKTHKTLRKPEPGTLAQAIRDVLESPGMERHYRAMFSDNAPTDLVLALTVMDVSATGPSPSQVTTTETQGRFGTLRFSYDDLRRAEKAQTLYADVTRLTERCDWAIDASTQIIEDTGETVPDLARYLDLARNTLRRAQHKAETYMATTALEQRITTTH